MKRAAALGLVLGTALTAGTAFAQTNTGTAIGQFMLIEPSARIAAMGNAGVSMAEGIQGIYYNPAALGSLDGASLQFTHSFWFAEIRYDYAAVALPIGRLGNFFGSITSLNSGDIDVRTVEFPLGTGERYTVSDVGLGLGYARQITSRFAAGLQVNYLNETIWNSSAGTIAFNVGTVYRLTEGGMRLGASLSNFGTKAGFSGDDLAIQYDQNPDNNGDNSALPADQFTGDFPVPVLFRVGISLPKQIGADNRLLLAVDALHPNDNTESLGLGAEWSWKDMVALRAGYQSLFQEDAELGPTLGVGIRAGTGHPWFHLDYSWAHHERLAGTHRLTFALAF
jgi:hypothetical protein